MPIVGSGTSKTAVRLLRSAREVEMGPATWGRAPARTRTRAARRLPVAMFTIQLRLKYRAKAHALASTHTVRSHLGPGLRGPVVRPHARRRQIAGHTIHRTPARPIPARPINGPAQQRKLVTTSTTATSEVSHEACVEYVSLECEGRYLVASTQSRAYACPHPARARTHAPHLPSPAPQPARPRTRPRRWCAPRMQVIASPATTTTRRSCSAQLPHPVTLSTAMAFRATSTSPCPDRAP